MLDCKRPRLADLLFDDRGLAPETPAMRNVGISGLTRPQVLNPVPSSRGRSPVG